MGLYIKSFMQV